MAKTASRASSIRFRDLVAYAALAVCAGIGLLVIALGEQANAIFGP